MIIIRSPQEIAAEINAIRRRAARQLLEDSVEVGRLLVEAKNSVQHGEWGDWLEENFQYSSTEANNLMRLYEAYGTREQIGLFEEDRTAIFGRLNKSQAIALLGIPEPERAAFVAENPPEEISVREWEARIEAARMKGRQQAVDEYREKFEEINLELDEATKKANLAELDRVQATKAAREAVDKLAEASARAERAEEKAAGADKLRSDLEKEKERADKAANETVLEKRARLKAEKERADLQARIDELEENPVVTVREPTAEELAGIEDKLRAKIGTEAETLRAENKKLRMAADPVMQKFRRYFAAFQDAFAGMRAVIAEQTAVDPEKAARLVSALRRVIDAAREEYRDA